MAYNEKEYVLPLVSAKVTVNLRCSGRNIPGPCIWSVNFHLEGMKDFISWMSLSQSVTLNYMWEICLCLLTGVDSICRNGFRKCAECSGNALNVRVSLSDFLSIFFLQQPNILFARSARIRILSF